MPRRSAAATDIHANLARLGARHRLAELHEEMAAINRAYPDLGRAAPIGAREVPLPRARKRAGMSAAQKAEVSRRMKAYWAARRAGKSGASKSATANSGAKTKRTMSAAARKKISAAQKKRWAKQKAAEA